MDNVLELLAPCKTADIGIEAIKHGADAVYIGGPLFSARANAGNSIGEIERLATFAHRFNARVYMALNTIFTDRQLEDAVRLAHQAYQAGADALIVQDMGLLMSDLPPIQLHASTQCDIRTPEKARFLESVGFSQIVPARELTLEEIRIMSESLQSARIEFFIHGALCVSYSGQCYASQVLKGRSANCGDCAQICRLPFDVYTEENEQLCKGKHILSLKDNNQSRNIESLIAAGVRSFKIEGRYKDAAYVKNTTAFYRREIDRFLAAHPEFRAQSDGRSTLNFTPSLESAFNRGATAYFVNGRTDHMSAADTPKNAGRTIGVVKSVGEASILVKSDETLNNGDGLTFFTDTDELSGFLINKAQSVDVHLWEIFLREPPRRIPGLKPGLALMRNRDHAWLKKMNAETALRKIPIRIEAHVDQRGLTLKALDAHHHCAAVTVTEKTEVAKNPEKAEENLVKSLSKLGDTDFIAESVTVEGTNIPFLPASLSNALRRDLMRQLERARALDFRPLPRQEPVPALYPQQEVDYHANVSNQKAKAFYERHGAKVLESAVETEKKSRDLEVMRCRYCIRHELQLCPKQAKARGEKIKPSPLTLKYGRTELIAKFDCKRCEMSVIAPFSGSCASSPAKAPNASGRSST